MDEEPKAQRWNNVLKVIELMRGAGRFSHPQLSASLESLHAQLGCCAASLIDEQM